MLNQRAKNALKRVSEGLSSDGIRKAMGARGTGYSRFFRISQKNTCYNLSEGVENSASYCIIWCRALNPEASKGQMKMEEKEVRVGMKIKTREGCGCGYDEFETEVIYEVVEIDDEKGKAKVREASRIDTVWNGEKVHIERVAMGSPFWCKINRHSDGDCVIRNKSRGVYLFVSPKNIVE